MTAAFLPSGCSLLFTPQLQQCLLNRLKPQKVEVQHSLRSMSTSFNAIADSTNIGVSTLNVRLSVRKKYAGQLSVRTAMLWEADAHIITGRA